MIALENVFRESVDLEGTRMHALSRLIMVSEDYSQQSSPQVTSFFPLMAALIIADAQPTPLSTLMAEEGQLTWQAPHSMHFSGRERRTFPSPLWNTRCGHTSRHLPQLTHLPGKKTRVLMGVTSEGASSPSNCIKGMSDCITPTPSSLRLGKGT